MQNFWKIVRWIVSIFLILIIFFTVTFSIPVVSMSQTFTSRNNIKSFLNKSGIYENVFETILKLFPVAQGLNQGGINFTDFLKKIVKPEDTKKNVEIVIDGTYDWLEGKTERPIFEITIIPENVSSSDFLKEYYNELPECAVDSDFSLQQESSFKLTCRPKSFDLSNFDFFGLGNSQSEKSFKGVKIKSTDMLLDPVLSKRIQGIYFYLRYAPIFLGLYILVLLGLLILTVPSFSRGRGFIIAGIVLFVSSIIFLISSIVGALLDFKIVLGFLLSFGPGNVGGFLNPLIDFLRLIYLDIVARTLHYSLIVMIFSILLFVIGMIMRSKVRKSETTKKLR